MYMLKQRRKYKGNRSCAVGYYNVSPALPICPIDIFLVLLSIERIFRGVHIDPVVECQSFFISVPKINHFIISGRISTQKKQVVSTFKEHFLHYNISLCQDMDMYYWRSLQILVIIYTSCNFKSSWLTEQENNTLLG